MLLNESTKLALEAFTKNPSHGLLIIGPEGAGKKAVAESVAAVILEVVPEKLPANPNYILLTPENNAKLGIDDIRNLKSKSSLRSVSKHHRKRATIISNAETMTLEAQNAILKTLEEPQPGMTLILTASDQSGLLPTVRSRLQKITIKPIELESAHDFYRQSSAFAVEKAWRLSGGYPGLMDKLIKDDGQLPLLESIEKAKNLVNSTTYGRLIKINDYSKDEAGLLSDLDSLDKVLTAGHRVALLKNNHQQAKKILKARKALRLTRDNLMHNANLKLNLTHLFTELG